MTKYAIKAAGVRFYVYQSMQDKLPVAGFRYDKVFRMNTCIIRLTMLYICEKSHNNMYKEFEI